MMLPMTVEPWMPKHQRSEASMYMMMIPGSDPMAPSGAARRAMKPEQKLYAPPVVARRTALMPEKTATLKSSGTMAAKLPWIAGGTTSGMRM